MTENPGIDWSAIEELRRRPHPLLHVAEFDPPLPMGVGEVLLEARAVHHMLDMLGIPHGTGYGQDLDSRMWLAVQKFRETGH